MDLERDVLDGVTIDQLRTFIAAADEGSFSAAGRTLRRAQSVVSQTLANLEAQAGVALFDRTGRYPALTDAGRALLSEARTATAAVDHFKATARELAGGLEPELSIVVDVMFPIEVLAQAFSTFREKFPSTALRIEVEALGAVLQPVMQGRAAFCIMGSLPFAPPQFKLERLRDVAMAMVTSSKHPLASLRKPIPNEALQAYTQLVLSDRSDLSKGKEFAVFSERKWRLGDLGAKHAFLRAGLGYGGMPRHVVADDLASGTLVELKLSGVHNNLLMPMSVAYRTETPPGVAGRWLIERLKETIEPDKLRSKVRRSPQRKRAVGTHESPRRRSTGK